MNTSENLQLLHPDNRNHQEGSFTLVDGAAGGSAAVGSGSSSAPSPTPSPTPSPDTSSNTGDTRAGTGGVYTRESFYQSLIDNGYSPEVAKYLTDITFKHDENIIDTSSGTGYQPLPTFPENYISPFQPLPDATPEQNLQRLSQWISYVCSAYDFSNASFGKGAEFNFANALLSLYSGISTASNDLIRDLSDAATLEISEKIADQVFSFINTQFNAAMSYQSWYLQQDYNSPINQVDRLARAGLSSAFVVGSSLGSGNAQSSASMPQLQQPAASNAGQAEAQAQANKGNFITSLLGAIGSAASLVSTPFEIYKGVLEADAIKRLTPLQISQASANILNSAATYEKLLNDNTAMRQSMQYQQSQLKIQASQSALDNQGKSVELAKGAADTFFERNAVEFRNIGYSTHVKDKSGNTVRKVYDLDGMRYINEHNGRDMEGNQVVDSKYYKRNHNVNASGGINWGVPGMGGGNVSASYGFGFESQNAHSNTSNNSHEKGYSNSSQNQQDHSEGKDTSSSWRIGDTEFKQEITVKRVLPNQYQAEFDRLQGTYEEALKTFNSMSDKHKSLMLQIKSCQDFNFGNQSKINVMKAYQHLLNNTFNTDNVDKTLVGD